MIVLGIESTAHTLGLGIYDSNTDRIYHVKGMYRPSKGEGLVPRKMADHHQKVFLKLLQELQEKSGIGMNKIDAVAFSQGPGIGQCLQAGAFIARHISVKYNVPLIPVNHCQAHIEIGKWDTKIMDPLVVYVSGGNTQIIIQEKDKYKVVGETLDIGMGNLFDVLGRELKLEYAHGSVLEQMAQRGKYIPDTPYSVKGMNFVFAGLLTHASKRMIGKYSPDDIVYSVMHTAFAEVAEAAERVLCLTHKKGVLLVGGVAQNKMFQDMLSKMASSHGAKFAVPSNEYNADNGAMIAYTGFVQRKKGVSITAAKAVPRPRWRVDGQ